MDSSTSRRQVSMLSMLPMGPRYTITVPEISSRLTELGMNTSVRTVQRDLQKLSSTFDIECHLGKPNRWCWKAGAHKAAQPAMDLNTAIAFNLLEKYLSGMLPQSVYEALNPWFTQAEQTLYTSPKTIGRWHEKIHVQRKSLSVTPPKVDPEIQAVLYECINDEVKANITYSAMSRENRPETYTITPIGIVMQDERIYVASKRDGQEHVALRAMHRISRAERIEKFPERIEKIDLRSLANQSLTIAKSKEPIKLVMKVSRLIGRYLMESPLSPDQSIKVLDDKLVLLKMSVLDSVQLRSWIFSLGPDAEVVKPRYLRDEISLAVKHASEIYDQSS